MKWIERGADLYHSKEGNGRFDILFSPAFQHWVAIDWDRGRTFRGTWDECEKWCVFRRFALPDFYLPKDKATA